MDKDLSTLISLVSAIISLASFFGLFYKMKYQLEQMEKKQDKLLDSLNDAVKVTYQNQKDIVRLQVQHDEIVKDIQELKGVTDGEKRRQYGTRTS